MKKGQTVSRQLRLRRRQLGLSLSDVARRAGTSSATLSRYENGWSRFEVYTLRKLATALRCELNLELRPIPVGRLRPTNAAATRHLKRLFWDRALTPGDLAAHQGWVVQRVLDYGNLDDIAVLREFMGRRAFAEAAAKQVERLSERSRVFWRQVLENEGISCTRKRSRNAVWPS